jgi:hypothetical protein
MYQTFQRGSSTRAALGPERRLVLRWAEQDVAEDPRHVHWRRRTTHGTTLDGYAAAMGLLVEFRVMGAAEVELVDLIDLDEMR